MLFGLPEELFHVLMAFGLGLAPLSEVRGAALYAFGIGREYLLLFGILGNIAAMLLLLLLWDLLHIEKIGRMILGDRIERKLRELENKYEAAGTIGLALFIGAPVVVTGVYTGILLAKILGIPDKNIIGAGLAGILISSSIMYLVLKGLLSIPLLF